MSNKKITELDELAGLPNALDEFVVVDKSDTTMSADGTNKRNKFGNFYSITSEASSATPTPTGNAAVNNYYLTALETDPTFAEPSGTAALGNSLYMEITATGATRTLAWNAVYVAGNTHSLPTEVAAGDTIRVGFKYDGSEWILVALDVPA